MSRGWTGIRVRVRVRAFFLAVRIKVLFPIVDLDVSDHFIQVDWMNLQGSPCETTLARK